MIVSFTSKENPLIKILLKTLPSGDLEDLLEVSSDFMLLCETDQNLIYDCISDSVEAFFKQNINIDLTDAILEIKA